MDFRLTWPEFNFALTKGFHDVRTQKLHIQDMKLAGLVEGTRREYLRAVRQLAAYYMVSPDRLRDEKSLVYSREKTGRAADRRQVS